MGRALLLLAALCASLPALAGMLYVDVLDVGQGDSILIRGGGKAVLIDASIRKADVVGQLRRLGVQRLDLVVASHPHADHIGGMQPVVEALDIGLYMDNGLPHTTQTYEKLMTALDEREVPYRPAKRGMTLNLGDEAVISVLFPADTPLRGTRSDLNSNSVVLRLDHGDVSFLFTGDSEEPTEHALLTAGIEPVDVLKVAHHGSGHSSSPGFLRTLAPQYAFISCGDGNRYGHPDLEALVRLEAAGALIFRTDKSGQIRAISDGTTVEVFEGSLAELGRGTVDDGQPSGPAASGPGPAIGVDRTPMPMPAPVRPEPVPAPSPAPAASPEPGAPTLSGVQEPNPEFEDLEVGGRRDKKRRKKRRKKGSSSEEAEPAPAPAP